MELLVGRDLGKLLEKNGTTVEYAFHPVAGRMPGHMNVLLAEADVPYDQLYDLEAINRELDQTEIAIVNPMTDGFRPNKAALESEPLDSGAELFVYDEAAERYHAAEPKGSSARP